MKFLVVLNRKIDLVGQINGAGHLCLGFVGWMNQAEMALRPFHDSSGRRLSVLTDFPLIVLEARSGDHLREAHDMAISAGIPCNAFFEAMRSGTPQEQQDGIQSSSAADLRYVALAMFGSSNALRPLTRRFSLLKPNQNPRGDNVSCSAGVEL
jgi:hypothetical protein